MYENLRKLREDHGMNQEIFAALFGVTRSTYSNYETGKTEPDSGFWIAVAEKYHVSIDYLMGFTDDPHRTKYAAQSKVEANYYNLDEHGRRIVDAVMEIEAERSASNTVQILPKKVIPLFLAAAGPSEPVPDTGFEDYEVDQDSPASFAVKVSGDSMEPELHDGEIVLCKKKQAEVGELAVVMVNGFLVVKQFDTDGQNAFLRSLNRERKDLDIVLSADGNDTVIGYGTVIHKKLPVVK